MSQLNDKTITYIAGDGHSGSTLLDIILGAKEKTFSSGELMFFPQKGIINNEYCSCQKPIHECEIWGKVIQEWDAIRKLPLEQYIQIQNSLTTNKKLIQTYRLLQKPTIDFKTFIQDTISLYDLIFSITNSNTIIDSSKNPNRILILKQLGFKIVIIHLTRRFGDVLNSYKKEWKKDLKAGIEENILPQKTPYILSGWFLKNFLTQYYGKTMQYHKMKYENLIHDPERTIAQLALNWDNEFTSIIKNRGPFIPKHLVAGNRMRMKDKIYISEKPHDTSYSRLKNTDKILSRSIDYFY